jgi:hypothetical protein
LLLWSSAPFQHTPKALCLNNEWAPRRTSSRKEQPIKTIDAHVEISRPNRKNSIV